MLKIFWGVFLFFTVRNAPAQFTADSISAAAAKKYISFLAADNMGGRVNFSANQLEAAAYLAKQFNSFGLVPYPEYNNFYQPFFTSDHQKLPPFFTTDALHTDTLYNIVGILPGKSKAGEAIIFSAHYDHVEAAIPTLRSPVYNGANDNASGTTAVLLLADYFAKRHDNERTLVFCLFAAEELGLIGSRAFARQVEADSIIAVINVEMIGMHNRSGKNKFFLTGSGKSTLEDILAKNLSGTPVAIHPEGADVASLFTRSDNYSFAKKGIVAHSIMCSDDNDPCYHKPCDDTKRIDFSHFITIIRGIAIACQTLVDGTDTPVWKQ